jgi:general nucleoside transport system permease protein
MLANERIFEVVKMAAAVLLALILTFVLLLIFSAQPLESFSKMLFAPLTKVRYMGNVIETMIPLSFAGLATALLFRTKLFNLGTEGIFYFCGVVTAAVATQTMSSALIHPFVTILISGLVGGLIALIPGFFKAKYNTNELVTSLMMNSILFGLGLFIIKNFMQALDVPGVASHLFQATAKLPVIIPSTRIHFGIVILIITVIALQLMLFHTKLGYTIRMTGLNKNFARYSGMNAFWLFLVVHFISGFIGGVGSSVELLGMYNRFQWSALPGLGFTGALMAMLGRNHPVGVVAAAFAISYLRTGADIMARTTDVPVEIVAVVEAVVVLFVSSQYFLRKYHERALIKKGGEQHA